MQGLRPLIEYLSKTVADKLNIFVRHVTLRVRPPLRPCAFRLSGAAWGVLNLSSWRFSALEINRLTRNYRPN